MPKEGFHTITVPNDLYCKLKEKSDELNISIGDYISLSMPSWLSPAKRLIRNQQIEGSNPSGGLPASADF